MTFTSSLSTATRAGKEAGLTSLTMRALTHALLPSVPYTGERDAASKKTRVQLIDDLELEPG